MTLPMPQPMTAPTIIIHDLDHATAALAAAARAGLAVELRSAAGAGAGLGPGVFKAITEQAFAHHADTHCIAVLDCGDEAGTALAAIRAGCRHVAIDLDPPARDKLADLAAARDIRLHARPAGPVLDLADVDDAPAALRIYLEGDNCDG